MSKQKADADLAQEAPDMITKSRAKFLEDFKCQLYKNAVNETLS